uniref:Adenosine kinase n=1 Tax=Panagrolaimus sp. JU765 TaxID=591449 RepID=A0AC34RML1_9BILA
MVAEIPEGVLIGMCNPLLDFQATVGKDFLDKYGLKENDAILADEKHLPLFSELQNEYEVDYIPGGAAQNVLRTFQWIVNKPNRTVFFGAVGNDEYGQKLKEKATSAGVNVHYQVNQDVKTGTCAALIYKHHRSLAAHLAAANTFTIDHLDKPENIAAVEKAQFYYITGFFITVCPEAILRVAKHAAEHNKVVMFNISAPFVSQFYGPTLAEILPYVDIFFGNEEEVKAYAKCNDLNTEDITEIAKKLAEIPKVNSARQRLVVVTQGPDPVITVHDGKLEEFPVHQLTEDQIVDTNGAGDAFCGGFVSQYVQGKTLKECVEVGCYAAREVITQQGCTFPEHCAVRDK